MDPAGNVVGVSSMARTFAYDAVNQQTTATVNGVTTTCVYDGEGQRVQKTVGGVVTTYVYDAAGELAAEYAAQPVCDQHVLRHGGPPGQHAAADGKSCH